MWLGEYKLEFNYILKNYSTEFLEGTLLTLKISIIVLIVSLFFGFIFGLGLVSEKKFINKISIIYVELMRNLPVLVVLFFFFYGLPEIGVRLQQVFVGILALSLHTGAYVAEIIKTGIRSIDREQYFSSLALGMSKKQCLWYIIIPQIKVDILPALTNQFIYTIKDTPLLAFILVRELMSRAYDIQTNTWKVIEIYTIIGLIYLFFSASLSFVSIKLERYFNKYKIS